MSIDKCVNYGKIVVYSASNTLVNNVGGVIGNMSGGSEERPTIVAECYNYGDISFIGNTGGVAGNVGNGNIQLRRCGNYGALAATAGNGRTGGVAGGSSGVIDECFNLGTVSCSPANGNNTGGIVGYNLGAITGCTNVGSINTEYQEASLDTDGFTAKMVDYINSRKASIDSSDNSGSSTTNVATDTGGIAG